MATFEEFVQLELPKRLFTEGDGTPGQMLVRSNNPLAVRELIWANIPNDNAAQITLEAGEDLAAGTPVRVSGNKFYAASHSDSPQVVGIVRNSVQVAQPAIAVTSGSLALSGLSAGSPYFLGVGAITTTAPSFGFVVRLGMAVTASVLLVNIEEPILIS